LHLDDTPAGGTDTVLLDGTNDSPFPSGGIFFKGNPVQDLSVLGTTGNDSFVVSRSGANLVVKRNGTQILSVPLSSITSLRLDNTATGNDTVVVDPANGSPFPTGGIFFKGHAVAVPTDPAVVAVAPGPGGGPDVKVYDKPGSSAAPRLEFYAYAPDFAGGV